MISKHILIDNRLELYWMSLLVSIFFKVFIS